MNNESINKQEDIKVHAEEIFLRYKSMEWVRHTLSFIREGLKKKYPEASEKFGEILAYHGEPHAEDVLHEAILFAISEGISDEREIELLAVAAVFHDAGFIREYDANETIGAGLAEEFMRESEKYTEAEIQRVRDIILSTRVKFDPGFKQLIVSPEDILQRVIADADVSNFGREDFDEKAEAVYMELMAVGKIKDDTPETRKFFNNFRQKMIMTHNWNTDSARLLRDEQKQKNLEILNERIK